MPASSIRYPGLRVVVLGTLGQIPFAGVAWQALHYLEGLRRLECRVAYLEDTGAWPYDAEKNTITDDPSFTLRYLRRNLEWCAMGEAWAYRAACRDHRIFGPLAESWTRTLRDAEVLINLTGATVLRDEHLAVPRRIYLETDPVLPQIEVATGKRSTIDYLAAHTHHFTFGENLGAPDCLVPPTNFRYRPTRQPVVLDWWEGKSPHAAPDRRLRFTTVANWRQTDKDIVWKGETYGWSKDVEFRKFLDLPAKSPVDLELALACGDRQALAELQRHGWRVRDALPLSGDILPYRDYLIASDGEFSVAKDQNVRLRSGWFSDRSACYLAAGRPVVVQDTAFNRVLPVGEGLFAFRTEEEARVALATVAGDYRRHAEAARAIASQYFDAPKVLAALLEAAFSHASQLGMNIET